MKKLKKGISLQDLWVLQQIQVESKNMLSGVHNSNYKSSEFTLTMAIENLETDIATVNTELVERIRDLWVKDDCE